MAREQYHLGVCAGRMDAHRRELFDKMMETWRYVCSQHVAWSHVPQHARNVDVAFGYFLPSTSYGHGVSI